MTERPLERSVEDFISRLNCVIDASLDTDIRFSAEFVQAGERAIVQAPHPPNRRSAPGRAAAHVHLHANSPELAWIYGSSGQPAPDLHALHFPVGGKRFRPTLEDFLLFLDREGIFANWKPGWRTEVIESLAEWDRSQARATVRRYPEEAITQLEDLGHVVTPAGGISV